MRIRDEESARAYVAEIGGKESLEPLQMLEDELRQENVLQNLVAKNSLECVWQRHIADSAQLIGHAERSTRPWMDLGSGAGFPGLVIAALRPEIPVILVESRKRRIDWLERMKSKMQLDNCRIEGARLEQVETFEAGVITARAFAPLDRLLALSARFSTSRTRWVLPKGRSAAQEVAALSKFGRKMFHVEQSLTDNEAGIVVGTGKWSEKS
ncbi:16S rRNA (guanine(527)-N(7))-methyltransferase RsmG [Qipengyuania soli]|nr:16S rRNA (guanine(527)-N(7))-methyltransferase RsmG [Qipengyuania soli]